MRNLILVLLFSLLTGCYSSRKFNTLYDQNSKEIVQKVFTKGHASCERGVCFRITAMDSTNHSYKFYGERILGLKAKVKAKSLDNKKSFLLKLKITNIAGSRIKDLETRILNEIGYALEMKNP